MFYKTVVYCTLMIGITSDSLCHTLFYYFRYLFYVNNIFDVKKQNKFCCIVICYCELKLKLLNIIFLLKTKGLLKGRGKTSMLNDSST